MNGKKKLVFGLWPDFVVVIVMIFFLCCYFRLSFFTILFFLSRLMDSVGKTFICHFKKKLIFPPKKNESSIEKPEKSN